MRHLRASLTASFATFLAAFYLLLGVSASWHAPHFSRGESAVHVDRHAAGHEFPASGECARCAWKTVSQEPSAARVFTPVAHTAAWTARFGTQPPADDLVRVARARGPPALS